MQCRIHHNCFKKDQYGYINTLVGCASCHSEFIEVLVDDGAIDTSNQHDELSSTSLELLLQTYIANGISSSTYEGEIIEIDAAGDTVYDKKVFSPKEAVDYINEPLSILVENNLNDGRFVRAVIRCFGGDRLRSALTCGKVRMENSGGCGGSTNYIKGCLADNYKSKFLRLYVLWDSDREYPSASVEKYEKEIVFLTQYGIHYHILEKRAMENYMPDEAVRSLCSDSHTQWYEAYSHLNETQKDFYNIAEGFSKYQVLSKNELPDKVLQLFSDLSDGNWEHLKNGLKLGYFKTTYPTKFEEKAFVYKESFLRRTKNQGNPNELQEIASSMEKLL